MAEENSSEFQNNLKLNADQLKAFADALVTATREAGPKAEADRKAADAAKQAEAALKALNQQLRTSVVDYGKSLLTGGEGVGKFGGAVTGATDAVGNYVQNLSSKFGPLAIVLGGLIKVIGGVAAASLKQNDAIMKSYRDLAEMGSVSGSLEKLKDDLGKVGLTSEETEKFANMLKKSAPELAAFGGSVTAGKDKLIGIVQGMIGPNNQIERSMARLGYDAESMRDATASYVRNQTQLGLSQGKTQDQLRQGSVSYMTTLRELQELTGMSRDEAQKLIEQQQSDYRFAVFKAGLNDKERQRLEAGMAAYEKFNGKEAATDLMEQIVNAGDIVGEKSARASQSTMNQGYENIMDVMQGTKSVGKMIIDTGKAVDDNMKRVGTSYNIAGQALNSIAGSEELLLGSLKVRNMTEKDIEKTTKQNAASRNGRLDQNTKIEQEARALRISADRAVWEAGNLTVSMFERLTRVMFGFGKGLAKIIDKISPVILGKQTNLSASFRDVSDVQTEILEAEQEKRNIQEENNRARERILRLQEGSNQRSDTQVMIENKQKEIEALKIKLSTLTTEKEKKETTKEIEKKQKEIDHLQRLKDSSGSKNNASEKSIQTEKQKILENEKRIQAEDKKIQQLEKEKLKIEGTGENSKDGKLFPGIDTTGRNISALTGQKIGQESVEARSQAASELEPSAQGRATDILSKIKFKDKKEGTGGGDASTALLGMAEKIHELLPNTTFTALNDLYHKKNKPGSKHTIGKALDFTIDPPPESPEDAASIKEQLKDLGATRVRDEYFTDKNDETRGGHFHVEVARKGGAFKGPNSGYPVMLHGKNESVWPENKLKSALAEVQKSSIEDYKNKLLGEMGMNSSVSSTTASLSQSNTSGMDILTETMTEKYESMIGQLEDVNDNLKNLLRYAKA